MSCSEFFGFCSGSDAWAALLHLSGIPLSEVPPGHICNLRHSKPCWDLNLGHSCLKFCNILVVSGLAAGFCLTARFRYSPFPLHLNRWGCLLNPCNKKFLNELRLIFRVLFRFRCLDHSAARLVDTPARSASSAHLHSVVFQTQLGSEPQAQLSKVLQHVCCERFGCLILPCCKVQMLSFSAASEPVGMLAESVQ